MRSFLLKIRFMLFPKGSRAEQAYHFFRVALLAAQTQGVKRVVEQAILELMYRRISAGSLSASKWLYRFWSYQNEPGWIKRLQRHWDCSRWAHKPRISILIYADPDAQQQIAATLHSLHTQVYPHWELCLVHAAQPLEQGSQSWTARMGRDVRVRLLVESAPSERTVGLNMAIEAASGSFVMLFTPGEILAPHALYEIAHAIVQDPAADLIYFDVDQIAAGSKTRQHPWFKPAALSPELLLSVNYWEHAAIRRDLVRQVGLLDIEAADAYEWDLALRILEGKPKTVHIPYVLLHGLTSCGQPLETARPLTPAHKLCLTNHLSRVGHPCDHVDRSPQGAVHVHWPESHSMVSILIPTRDKADLLRACLRSILSQTNHPNYEIILIDTGSVEPETAAFYTELETEPRIRIVHYEGIFNFQSVNNFGVTFARGSAFVFLNNDTEALSADWLTELVGWLEKPGVGIVGAKLLRPNGTIQHAGLVMGLAGHGSHAFDGAPEYLAGPFGSTEWYRNYQVVTGACMAVRRVVFEALNGFDETYQVGYGDIDLCLRAVDAGWRVVYSPFARLVHHEGATRRFSQPPADVLRATVRMYPRIIQGDPYFSPNLSVLRRIPTIREPFHVSRDIILYKIQQDFDLIAESLSKFPLDSIWQKTHDGRATPPGTPLRALVITHELSASGAPIMLLEVARALKQHGVEVLVTSPEDGPLRSFCEANGLTLRLMPNILKDVRAILWLLRDCDLLIANTILAHRAVHAARAFRKPSFWWIHESSFGQQKASAEPAVALAFDQADAVIFPARTTADLYRSFTRHSNFHVIYNGVHEPTVESIALAIQPTQKIRIVSVGSIESRKGQDILLNALATLAPQDRQRFECVFIGRMIDWAEPEFCRQVTQHAKALGNVHFLGVLPANQVGAYLSAGDIFVLPSRDEVLPLSLIQAMALARPVIATRVGGIAEIIEDGVNGLLVDSEDSQALASALISLTNPDFRRALGHKAQLDYQHRLTNQHFLEEMMNLIESMIKLHNSQF